jgi:pimeloyl-ACP methyl ester carboxylesterase
MHARRAVLVLALAVGMGAAGPAARAQEGKPKDVAGAWSGTLQVARGVSLRIVLKVTKSADGALAATFASPDQGPGAMPVDAVALDGDTLTFAVNRIGGTYRGTRNAAGDVIDGTWTQLGNRYPLTLKPGDGASTVAVPEALVGLWQGKLVLPGGTALRLVLRVEAKEGRRTAVLDSPDQGVNGIPVTAIALDGDAVTFANRGIGGSYAGTLDRAKGVITGTWTQPTVKAPLELKKTEKVEEARRPQNPKPPFPYRAEDVTYRNDAASLTLAGTLTLPPGDGPFPAVVLLTGSGPQDRDETLMGHKPFLVLADALARRGIAVLRSDDRGVGGSGGSMATATSHDFADDALAAFTYLKTRKEIDPRRIGLVGHSEGGLIAPLVAVRADDVAFLVLLAGTGVPGSEIVLKQNELIARAAGASEESIRKQVEGLRTAIEAIAAEPDDDAVAARIRPAILEILSGEGKTGGVAGDLAGVEAMVKQLTSPWFRTFLALDPRLALARVKCPVLALNGEKDLQVPPSQNLPEIAKALASGGNPAVTIKELPGLNHLFQPAKTGAPSEYAVIETTFDPEALTLIADWVLERAKK